jgi:hypothetical protein
MKPFRQLDAARADITRALALWPQTKGLRDVQNLRYLRDIAGGINAEVLKQAQAG